MSIIAAMSYSSLYYYLVGGCLYTFKGICDLSKFYWLLGSLLMKEEAPFLALLEEY